MPQVGNKKFPYTPAGIQAAKNAQKKKLDNEMAKKKPGQPGGMKDALKQNFPVASRPAPSKPAPRKPAPPVKSKYPGKPGNNKAKPSPARTLPAKPTPGRKYPLSAVTKKKK